jgi:hypothetical protein
MKRPMQLLASAMVWFDKNLSDFLEWRDARRKLKSLQLFYKLYNDKKSGMSEMVGNKAQHIALAMVMNFFDAKRIAHCRFCPVTGPLHRMKDYMVCDKHLLQTTAEEKKEASEPVSFKPVKESVAA